PQAAGRALSAESFMESWSGFDQQGKSHASTSFWPAKRCPMRCRRFCVSWLGLLAGALWVSGASTAAESPASTIRPSAASSISLDQLPERARQVVEQPTLYCHGPSEVFVGRPALYYWLLDHPDRAALAWRRLGAPCLGITERGPSCFGWSD